PRLGLCRPARDPAAAEERRRRGRAPLHRRRAARGGRRRLLARRPLGRSRLAGACFLEDEVALPGVDENGVALGKLAFEKSQRQGVLDQALQRSLERPGAVSWPPTGLGAELFRVVRQRDPEAGLSQPLAQTREL